MTISYIYVCMCIFVADFQCVHRGSEAGGGIGISGQCPGLGKKLMQQTLLEIKISHQDVSNVCSSFLPKSSSSFKLKLLHTNKKPISLNQSRLVFFAYTSSFFPSSTMFHPLFLTLPCSSKVTPLRSVNDQATLAEIFSKETNGWVKEKPG